MKVSITVKSGNPVIIVNAQTARVAKAMTSAFREGGDKLKQRGRASIAGGGFSSRWQNAFRVNVYPKNGNSVRPRIFAYHKIKYAGQFEEPEPVRGSPYVWLPIEKNLPLQGRGKRWTPHDFVNNVGPLKGGRHGSRPILFGQVTVSQHSGVPLALPISDRTRHGERVRARFFKANKRKAWLPVFVGVSSVNDPKRFNLTGAAEVTAAELGGLFGRVWDSSNG